MIEIDGPFTLTHGPELKIAHADPVLEPSWIDLDQARVVVRDDE
jgi:hypothetical protein